MKTILIPVDFSKGSMRSCQYAIRLCSNKPARLILFHIYPDQLMIPDSSFPVGIDSDAFLNTEFISELRNQSELNMNEFSDEIRDFLKAEKLDNFEISQEITGGDPEWEIQDVIKEVKPELIVMGTSGEGNKGFLEGSISEKIMTKTEVPVFAVPFSAGQITFENVMYATNFSDHDLENMQTLIKIFDAFDTNLHVVHFKLTSSSDNLENRMDSLRKDLTNEFPEKKITFHLFNSEDKEDSLRTFIEENQIDLISFIAHKTNVFKNLFSHKIHKKDFFKLELPMLALASGRI